MLCDLIIKAIQQLSADCRPLVDLELVFEARVRHWLMGGGGAYAKAIGKLARQSIIS